MTRSFSSSAGRRGRMWPVVNVAGQKEYAEIQKRLRGQLERTLTQTQDPRALGQDAPWDYYPYYGTRRNKTWKVDRKP